MNLSNFKSMKLYVQIAFISFFTLLVFFIIIFFTYTQTTKNFKAKNEQYTNEIILQLKQTIYTNYNALSKIAKLISYDKDVQNFLMEDTEPFKYEYFQNAFSILVNLQTLNDQILDIIVENGDGKRYNITDGKAFDIPIKITGNKINVSPILHYKSQNTSIPYVIMGKNIYSSSSYIRSDKCIGSVYLVLGGNAFISTNQSSFKDLNSNIYLYDSNFQPFWSNSKNNENNEFKSLSAKLPLIDKGLLVDKQNDIRIEHLKDVPISIVSILKNEDFVDGIKKVQLVSYFIFLIAFLFIAIIWIMLIRNIVNPLKKLVCFISTIKEKRLSGLKVRMNLSGYQEINIVNTEFNEMLESVDKLTRQLVETSSNLYEVEIDKREIELAHMRSQINPHFLYNTLETIKGIALQEGIPEISKITKSLATIFKYSIKGENLVPLKDELKIGKSYLEIQLFRFSERFDVTYDIDQICTECYVPKMILQPIIENSIVHGIESHDKFCNLTISAKLEDSLIITVKDNGNGISSDKLNKIIENLFNPKNSVRTEGGIGIHNINNRIQLIYGDKYGVSIDSVLCQGTSVTIKLPIDRR